MKSKRIGYDKHFLRVFRKRILTDKSLLKRFQERLEIFSSDRKSPVIRDHGLKGRLEGYRAFSITGDVRVVYFEDGNTIYFTDIGTHNEVY